MKALFTTDSLGFTYHAAPPFSWPPASISDNALAFSLSDDALCMHPAFPSRSLGRSLSRGGILLLLLHSAIDAGIKSLSVDRERTGLYGSIAKGSTSLPLSERVTNADDSGATDILTAELPPKQFFKDAMNIPGALLSIQLGIRGPLYNFPHWQYGFLHALQAAQIDLISGKIDAALVFGSFALDNPALGLSLRARLGPGVALREYAGAVVLTKAAEFDPLLEAAALPVSSGAAFHGHAEALYRAKHLQKAQA